MSILSLNSFHYMSTAIPTNELIEMEKDFYNSLLNFWRDHNLYTWEWWILVILSVLSPLVWWKFINKQRITEITAYGLFYGIAATMLDSIGSNALAWVYPVRLTPYLYPQFYPYDLGIVIIPFMLIYQRWGGSFKSFFLVSALQSAFIAFIAERFMTLIHVYHEITWKHIYSFPIYWLLALICWFIITMFKKIEQR